MNREPRGPRREIFGHCETPGGRLLMLVCGHSVKRRRILARQTVTTCELCRDAYDALDKAIARLSADDSDPRA